MPNLLLGIPRRVDLFTLATLPYYDAVVSSAIDPMHTLFQCIVGSIVNKWINDKIICKKELGRLFHKYEYAKGLGKLTAADWMNFVFTMSTPVLSDLLPADDLKMWKHYVAACTILCSHYVDQALLPVALNHFRKCFTLLAELYGEQFITPSMHQALHLPLLSERFGPASVFWGFGYERRTIVDDDMSIGFDLHMSIGGDNYLGNHYMSMCLHSTAWPGHQL
jgi:hypothetical protein